MLVLLADTADVLDFSPLLFSILHVFRKCFAIVRSTLEKHISQIDAVAKAQIGEWQECLSKAKHREESLSKELKNLRYVHFFPQESFFSEVAK